MFSKTTVGIVALTVLSEEVRAMKAKYRPVPGTAPWHKDAEPSSWVKPDWKVDYFVPNFGLDEDIKSSLKHTGDTESKLKHKLQASFKAPKGHPVDYFVPNFGEDKDIAVSRKNLADTEKELKNTFSASFKAPKGHPVNYFVPNFGQDQDIKDSISNTNNAQKKLGHVMQASFKTPKGPPMNYFVPNFGLDHDILTAQKNIKDQEAKHGKWTPKQDGNGVWGVPADNNDYRYKLVQLDDQISLESDPICSSAGCDQYKHKKKKLGYPIDYPVPNFGIDHDDVHATDSSLEWAQKNLNHQWNYVKPGKTDPEPEYHGFGHPVDSDIESSLHNLQSAESKYG